jgi:CSLREA domain-containing protein
MRFARYELVAFVVGLGMAASAQAATLQVTSTADGGGDATPGNGTCEDSSVAGCTLRAAIQEANAFSGTDAITFAASFDGGNDDVITVASSLPAVTGQTSISATSCASGGPCAGLSGTSGTGIDLASTATGSSIEGIAFQGFPQAVNVAAAQVSIRRNWFGSNMAGTAAGSPVGVGVTAQGNLASIGWLAGDGPAGQAGRNVFSRFGAAAIRVLGADNTNVRGNWIGMLPDGTVPAIGAFTTTDNSDGVQVAGLPGDPATGTLIGESDQNVTQTAACDGPCNVIAGVSVNGIDLSGGGTGVAGATAAGATNVRGNYVGLDDDGADARTSTNASGREGIALGLATPVTVGGAAAADRNYIGGNPDGISSAPGIAALVIRNNWIGVEPDGSGSVPNHINSIAVSGAVGTNSVIVRDNVIAGGNVSRSGVYAYGRDTLIQDNKIGMDNTGASSPFFSASSLGAPIVTQGSTNGLTVRGNFIGQGSLAGILWEGSGGLFEGNFIGITSSGGLAGSPSGILVRNGGRNAVIGTSALPNNISNQAGSAVRVVRAEGIEFRENIGISNGAIFYDLEDPAGPGNAAGPTGAAGTGSADGLQAPAISGFSPTQVNGQAQPDAVIRVFRMGPPPDNQLNVITPIGQATAAPDGSFSVPVSLSEGERFAATQTVHNPSVFHANTSELSQTYVNDTIPPTVPIITGGPSGPTGDDTPSFTFTGIEDSGRAVCSVDQGTPNFVPCTSSTTHDAGPLSEGDWTFRVKGVDEANNESATAATRSFTVDTTAPAVDCCTSGPQGPTNQTTGFSFVFSSSGTSSVQCSLDQGTESFGPCDTPTQFNVAGPLAEGSYTFRVRATDAAGNSSTDTQAFTVDTTPPTVSCCTAGPTGRTNDATPSFEFSSTDAASSECSVDQGAENYSDCSSPTTHDQQTVLPDGAWTFRVRITDAAGNTAVETRDFIVDTQGPAVSIEGKKRTTKKRPRFKLSSPESGATFRCKLDRRAVEDCGATFRPSRALKAGKHKLKVFAVDDLGNSGAPKTFRFKVKRQRN